MPGPSVFIGSSSEGLEVARTFQVVLENVTQCECHVWDQEVISASEYALDELIDAAGRADFAVLVATPDDKAESRGKVTTAARDNVLLELGLFIGALGRQRVFILVSQKDQVKLPSDLNGLTHLPPFRAHREDGNLQAALTAPAVAARKAIERHGRRFADGLSVSEARASDQRAELLAEIELLRQSATAQGWQVRSSTLSAIRLISPRRKKISKSLSADPATARRELREYALELRSFGLRVSRRLRVPVNA